MNYRFSAEPYDMNRYTETDGSLNPNDTDLRRASTRPTTSSEAGTLRRARHERTGHRTGGASPGFYRGRGRAAAAVVTALVLALASCVPAGERASAQDSSAGSVSSLEMPEPDVRLEALEAAGAAEPEPVPGEAEIRAMAEAYPSRITETAVRGGEWALLMDGVWYVWANGRLLPESERENWEEYTGVRFYNYELGPLVLPEIRPEQAERFRGIREQRARDTRMRFNGFLDALYRISSESEADRLMERISFLDLRTRVHPLLVEPLSRVEARIREAAVSSPETAEFVRGLAQAAAYNWRNISGTARRSYHSYGVAIDLVPKSYNRTQAYWQWADDAGISEWWNIPLEDRWPVPQAVIHAFETNGFIWGGKWSLFDNIHFEYRPESIVMAHARVAAEAALTAR